MKNSQNKNPEKRKKVFMLLGIGLGVVAIGSGFAYWYFKGRKTVPGEDMKNDFLPPVNHDTPGKTPKKNVQKTKPVNPDLPKASAPNINFALPVTPPAPANKNFPLKAGSKNGLVKQVQEALILKYGKSILPKCGADGQFGKEFSNALISKGFPDVIDEMTYNKIIALNISVKPVRADGLTPEVKERIDIAKNIWFYSSTKKLSSLLEQLKRIVDITAYTKVNDLFKTIRLNGVRQTIVNGTLSIFSDDTAKQLLRAEFLRIGLKYDGEKWSLSGLKEKQIFSKQETTICSLEGHRMKVPSQTILGVEIGRIRGNTHFRTLDNQTLYVPTKHIKYV